VLTAGVVGCPLSGNTNFASWISMRISTMGKTIRIAELSKKEVDKILRTRKFNRLALPFTHKLPLKDIIIRP